MTRAVAASIVAVAAIAMALALFPVDVRAQAGQAHPNEKAAGPVPRAPDGKPDLSGVWWLGREPGLVDGRVGSPSNGPAAPAAPGSTFASLYQPWAVEKAKTLGDKDDPALRCIPSVGGPPGTNIFQLVQTPKLVVLLQETYHGFRLIPPEAGQP